MMRWTFGWFAAVGLGAGCLLVAATGCKEKEPASTPTVDATVPLAASQPDPVLEAMRRKATMPAAAAAQPQRAPTPGDQNADQLNSLFPMDLSNAAKEGDLEKVRQILNSGRPVMVVDKDGSTPVHYAAGGGQVKVLEYLFTLGGFTPNDVNQMKVTPLHWAAVMGHRNAVDFLVSRGARIDAVDNQGRTPLFAATTTGRADVIDYLIQKGANINIKDASGKTPLDAATIQLRLPGLRPEMAQALGEVVKMLTDHGAKAGTPQGAATPTRPAGQ